ncbi:MAG: RIP metalloprotease RseP [Thermomicrobiales bacterium]|nr:RIP metalloprotease RseP [Thermomicrobiales bacterium]
MSDGFFNGLYIIPILAFLILIHEFGHFFSARMCGVKVEEFGIGIPPRAKGWMWKGVLWSVNWIPFGGFVRVKGEDGTNMEPDSMNAKKPHQRAFFLAAGAGMNLLLAVVLMILVVGIEGVNHERVYIEVVGNGSPAAKAGWKPGDRIVEINGDKIESPSEVSRLTRQNAGEEMTVVIERRGQLVTTRLTPRENPPEGEGRVGVGMDSRYVGDLLVESVVPGSAAEAAGLQAGDRIVSVNGRTATDFLVMGYELERYTGFAMPFEYERGGQIVAAEIEVPSDYGLGDVYNAVGLTEMKQKPTPEKVAAIDIIPRGFQEAYNTTVAMIQGIRELFSSRENLSQIAGPVGMGQLTSELVEVSPFPLWVTLANLAIILSLNLALLNLLPLPALDGGRLFFVLVEVLRGGRKIAPEKEGLVHFAGLVVLIGFMFVVGFFDVNRILDGKSFIP